MKVFVSNYDDWVDLAKSLVGDDVANDIVQEAYIKLHDYNYENLNRSYIYLTIRSLCIDYLREKAKIIKVDVIEIEADEFDINKEYAYKSLIDKKNEEINKWEWYDKRLFQIYTNEKKSLRQLSKDTGISLTSLHYTIKHCKDRIYNCLKEDIDNYNENY